MTGTLIASWALYFAHRPIADHHPSDSVFYSAAFQCFKNLSFKYKIIEAKFSLKKTGSPTGMGHAVLYGMGGTYGVDGKPTGSALATSDDFDVSTLTGVNQTITFTFSGAQQYVMQPDAYYCIAFLNPTAGTIDGGNYVHFAFDDTVTHSLKIFGDYANGVWTSYLNDTALFYVYGQMVGVSASDLDAIMNLGGAISDTNLEQIIDLAIDTLNLFGAELPNMSGEAGSKIVTLTSKEKAAVFIAARAIKYGFYYSIGNVVVEGLSVSVSDLASNPVVMNTIKEAAQKLKEVEQKKSGIPFIVAKASS